MKLFAFGVGVIGLLGLAAAATAQQDPAKCATTAVASATVTDIPKLLDDAACFASASSSAIASQKLRLDKARALAKQIAQVIVGDAVEPTPAGSVTTMPPVVPSNVAVASLLRPAWATGAIPPTAAPDVVGAFRFLCSAGQVARDDPIVFAGQPGKSHLHQFYGNTGANASSTYASLRSSGDSTCMNVLNRSAYWMPAMLDGTGFVVRPDYVSIYYKRLPAGSAACFAIAAKGCQPLPRGLRYIFGYDMVTDTQPTGHFYFDCQGPTAKPGRYPTLTAAAAACGPGNQLGAVINAPNCWNGRELDSPSHRSHMAYATYVNGNLKCDDDHPIMLPEFTMGAWYDTGPAPTGSAGSVSTWYLSSDDMNMGGKIVRMTPGSTFHADWFGAWDDDVMAMWTEGCINRLLNCSGGDLGNGRQLVQIGPDPRKASPRLVPIPVT